MIDRGSKPLVYIGANPFIYLIEGNPTLASPIKEFFEHMQFRPGFIVTSELTLAEVLPKAPTPNHRRRYLDLIARGRILDLQPVTRAILIETAAYRKAAATALPNGRQAMPKLPDAIHVVTAIRSGCTRFLSTDAAIRVPADINLVEADAIGVASLVREFS